MHKKYSAHLIFVSIFLICSLEVSAQTYGLEFNGINESLDNRTELNLTPEGYLKFKNDFEISFDYKTTCISPDSYIGLFGYIVRIVNKDNKNVDLLSSIAAGLEPPKLNLVIGNKDSIVTANYSKSSIDKWIRLKVKFNLSKDQVIFYTPERFYVQENVGFKKKDEFKIIFGANDYKQFKTSDVPTMSIRDIKISEQGKLKYHWVLDEKKQHIATDRLLGHKAIAKNPVWLSLNHQKWQSNFETDSNGYLMITADTEKAEIFIVGSDELEIYSVGDNISKKVPYKNKPSFLKYNFKPIYNKKDHKIYCYLVGDGPPHVLDIETGVWERKKNRLTDEITSNNLYFNRYYNESDNSIYMFGGYGQHKYNNEISKIDINNNTLKTLRTNDTIFHPKYLSGLGVLNDTLYILGGYGSKSGNQLINPQSYYDLIGYSIKDSTLFKKFEISPIVDDMCIANSMWVDEDTRDYYALSYEKSVFNGGLQMIKGNLETSHVDVVGNKFPYQFLDVKSSAGLLYMKQQKKLFAFSTYTTDSNTTQAKIYSINYPPDKYIEEIGEVEESKDFTIVIVTFSCAVLFVIGFMYFRKKKKEAKEVSKKRNWWLKKTISNNNVSIAHTVEEEKLVVEKINYKLIFFGGFQVINNKTIDITNQFTPLIKELFLLLWLHTYKNDKGISPEKITEILWYDKSEKSAQNNRSVNLAKLRILLTDLGDLNLSKKTGYWKCVFDESEIRNDYVDFINLTSSKAILTKQKINQLIEITEKGPFLRNVQYEWLDEFKASVSDITIDTLTYFAQKCDVNKEADFIIHLADSIFIFDVTNEDAMILKCMSLYVLGKHSHAKATYKKFSKEYLELYGQSYEQAFVDIIKIKD